MHTRSKSPTEAQTAERAKSVAEIIGDIESYNEKKRQKEKEDERLVAERLLKLMELSEVPDAKTKPVAKQAKDAGEALPASAETVVSATETVKEDEAVAETNIGHETVEEQTTHDDKVKGDVGDVKDEVVAIEEEKNKEEKREEAQPTPEPIIRGEEGIQEATINEVQPRDTEEGVQEPTINEGWPKYTEEEIQEPIINKAQPSNIDEIIQEPTINKAVPQPVELPPIPPTIESTEEINNIQEQTIAESLTSSTAQETELVPEPWETQEEVDTQPHEEPEGPVGSDAATVALGPDAESKASLVEVIMKLDSIMNNLSG